MTTKSPVSMCGAKVGLCLPRRRMAAWEASRPSTTSVASITCQARVISPGLGLYVGTDLPRRCLVLVEKLGSCLRCAGAGARRRPRGRTRRAAVKRPRVFTHRTSKNEGTRRSEAGSKRPLQPPGSSLPQPRRLPPAGRVGPLDLLVAVVGCAQRHPDLGQDRCQVGGGRV